MPTITLCWEDFNHQTHIGQLLDKGKFNIYFVVITGYNAISGSFQTYPNFLFQSIRDTNFTLVTYPYAIRMKDKKYVNTKNNLYVMFKDYLEIVKK